jgi:DNA-directed RNA polymerase subunit omega
LNAELVRKALLKVGNPNVLVNLVSRRVRQLSSGGGGMSRPLVSETAGLHASDIAMLEITENKMTWEADEESILLEQATRKRKKG